MLYLFKFFTTWSVLLAIFHRQVFKYVNLLYVSFITLMVGLYMSFINPRKFVFYLQGERFVYNGVEKFIIVDMLFHLFVFGFIWSRYRGYYRGFDNSLLSAMCLFVIYLMTVNVRKIYGLSLTELGFAFVVANVLYFLLF